MATNGQVATPTSNDYCVHGTAIRSSKETVKTKQQQAAERQRLYRDRKRQVSNNEETLTHWGPTGHLNCLNAGFPRSKPCKSTFTLCFFKNL
jgi:hypothetical protein